MGGRAHPGLVPGGRGAAGGRGQDEGGEPRGRRLGSRLVEKKVPRVYGGGLLVVEMLAQQSSTGHKMFGSTTRVSWIIYRRSRMFPFVTVRTACVAVELLPQPSLLCGMV